MSGLREIARDVGVSVSLVSKVLNNKLGTSTVAQGTAKAIRERAKQLNYRPNKSATALASGRHNVIGVIVHHEGESSSGIVDETIRKLAAGADAYQQRLSLKFVTSADDIRHALDQVDLSALDGLIFAGVPHPESVNDLLAVERERRVPIVTIHDTPLHARLPNIGMNQHAVVAAAVAHLVEQGCRRIAHLVANETRHQGYRKALEAAGIAYDAQLVARAGFHAHRAEVGIRELLDRGVKFDAFAAVSDQHAIVVMNALLRRGIRVPEDVRITGIDDSPWCPLALSPLTSVSQQFGLRATMAVEMLMDRIAGKAVASRDVPPKLVVRASSMLST